MGKGRDPERCYRKASTVVAGDPAGQGPGVSGGDVKG